MDVLFVSLGVFIALAGGFLLQGLRYIPADPPHVAIVTVWGVPQLQRKKAGWRFFPLCPWWHGFILVDVSEKSRKVGVNVRTPDRAELEIPFSLTVTPNPDDPSQLIEYVRSGKESGALEQLEEMATERVREWAISESEGPQTWVEAMKSREEASAMLLKTIADDLPPISAPVPTPVLLKYFASPQKLPTPSEAKRWGENWEKVRAELDLLPAAETARIRGAIERRREEVRNMRQGLGMRMKNGLGVVLKRLNIGEIKPLGKVADKASRKAEEQEEREAEQLELEHLRTEIRKLRKMGFSRDAAIEVIQVERGKSTKAIEEKKYNLSAETRAMIEKIAPDILDRILGKLKGDSGDG